MSTEIENVYSAPKTNIQSETIQKKVYSPTQAALGSFLGGAISSIYFISQNFSVLEDYEAVKKTYIYGGLIVLANFILIFFLPDGFPSSVIPIAVVVATRYLVDQSQFSKEDIEVDENLDFHSNWRVFFVALIIIILTIVSFALVALIMIGLGFTF